jgi:hypothetical protein
LYTDIPLKVIILSVILELPLSVRGVGRRTQPISKLLYDSVVHQGYLSKFCELFCGHSSSSQEFVTVGITVVQYDWYSITEPAN